MKYYVCEGCQAEIPKKQPATCPLCGRKKFTEIEKQEQKDPEEEKYKKKYDEVLKKLEEYSEGTKPEDFKHSFAD